MNGKVARRLLLASRPAYVRAFGRWLGGERLTKADRAALDAVRDGDSYPVPPQFDPTIKRDVR